MKNRKCTEVFVNGSRRLDSVSRHKLPNYNKMTAYDPKWTFANSLRTL